VSQAAQVGDVLHIPLPASYPTIKPALLPDSTTLQYETSNLNDLKSNTSADSLYNQGVAPKTYSAGWNDHESYSWAEVVPGQHFDLEQLGPKIEMLSPEKQANLIKFMTTKHTAQNPPEDTLRDNVVRLAPFVDKLTPNNRQRLADNGQKMLRPAYHDGYEWFTDNSYDNICRTLERT
jgi:hypothetical protein